MYATSLGMYVCMYVCMYICMYVVSRSPTLCASSFGREEAQRVGLRETRSVAVIVENHSKLDSAFVDKLTRISMNTFGVTLSFENVRVPPLGYVGRVLKLSVASCISSRKRVKLGNDHYRHRCWLKVAQNWCPD